MYRYRLEKFYQANPRGLVALAAEQFQPTGNEAKIDPGILREDPPLYGLQPHWVSAVLVIRNGAEITFPTPLGTSAPASASGPDWLEFDFWSCG